jgi:transposase
MDRANYSAISRRIERHKPRSCSTSFTSCTISARGSTRCAKPNAPAQRQGSTLHQGQKYNLPLRDENLTLEGKRAGRNKRLNTAYVLKEAFGQLWDYGREGWARRFFDNWRGGLKWQRLKPHERFADMIDRHLEGIAAYCKLETKVSLGFVEGLNNKIRVFQRRAYRVRDEEYLRLKVLTCVLPPL